MQGAYIIIIAENHLHMNSPCSTQHFNVTLFLLVSMCCDTSKARKQCRCSEVFVVSVFKRVSSTVTATLGRRKCQKQMVTRSDSICHEVWCQKSDLAGACLCASCSRTRAMVCQLCWFSVEKKFTAPANEAGNTWDLSPAHQTLKLWIASQKGKTLLARRTGVWTNKLGSFVTECCVPFSLGHELVRLAVVLQVRLTALFLSTKERI